VWECALDQVPSVGRILVAGAGRGGLSWELHRKGHDVVSVDLHPEHFVAKDLTCELADLLQPLTFPDDSFDAVLAVEVVEHLENPWAFLREALRVVKPRGAVVFTSPNVQSAAGRIQYAGTGQLPYFREQSFAGCYHVTPIFSWAVERFCRTAEATLKATTYSRVDWPTSQDIPNYSGGLLRRVKRITPLNELTGEIACFKIEKGGTVTVPIGVHYR